MSIVIRKKLLAKSIKPTFSLSKIVDSTRGYCWACGTNQEWIKSDVINDELAETWGISQAIRDSFDARESMNCQNCGCSFRLRQLAEATVDIFGGSNLSQLVGDTDFRKLSVAEINSCGYMHQFLERLPKLKYSEYGSRNKGVRSENLEKLTYKSNNFDIVFTSDTFEHIPNIGKAFDEVARVLKPGGYHIFTVPAVWSGMTRRRAVLMDSGKVHNILSPSYHGSGEPDYLVFNEFGHDILDIMEYHGFEARIFRVNPLNLNDVSGVLVAKKI